MLANMMAGFPTDEDPYSPDITNFDKCEHILKAADWNSPNDLPIYKKGQNKLCQTFKSDFENIQQEITNLIYCYKSQLSTEQLLLLEKIKSPNFISALTILVDANRVFPVGGADFIVDGFIETLKSYDKLKSTIQ